MISLACGILKKPNKTETENQAHREQIGGCQRLGMGSGQTGERGSKGTNF